MNDKGSGLLIEKSLLEHARRWIHGMFEGLRDVDEGTRGQLLQSVGKYCASVKAVPVAKRLVKEEPDIYQRFERLRETVLFPKFRVEKENEWSTLHVEYSAEEEPCICPLVQYGVIDEHPFMCECTRGWIQTAFETLLEHPVTVKIEETVCQGADTCRFSVRRVN